MPGLDGAASGRCQRSGRSLESDHATATRAGGVGADAAGLPTLRSHEVCVGCGVAKGAYVLADAADGKPEVILMGTRQRSFALRERLRAADKQKASKPAWSACRRGICSSSTGRSYKTKCCRREVKARVSVEQASTFGWSRYVGPTGIVIGMHTLRRLRADQRFAEEVWIHRGKRSRGRPRSMANTVVSVGRKAK